MVKMVLLIKKTAPSPRVTELFYVTFGEWLRKYRYTVTAAHFVIRVPLFPLRASEAFSREVINTRPFGTASR